MREDIEALISENPINAARLHDLLGRMNTVDIADLFEPLNAERTVQIFRVLPKTIAADVFSYLVPERQQAVIEALTDGEVCKIMDELYVDDAVDFIEEMPANVVVRVLRNTPDEKRRMINQILQYPEESVGSIMSTEYVDLKADATVREAFDDIRKKGVKGVYTCYVIRRDKLLVGMVSAKTLMLARPQDRIGDIMDTGPVFSYTLDDQEQAAGLFRRYGLLSMPVVDKEKRLVGVVTVDDVVQIIEEETTEDFERMAALKPSDEPYLKTGVFRLARNRIPWLLVLMLSATITGMIISGYEDSLAVLPSLITFIPMLMNTSGNAGCQTSTLIIRGMALGEIDFRDILKVLWIEIRVAVLCGLCLCAVNFTRVYLMNGRDVMLSLTVTLSLFAVVLMAKGIGCILPILAQKIKLDPAILATPLITTILDGTSLVVYFTIARAVLKI